MTQAAVSSGTALKRTSWAIVALTIAAIWLACSDKPDRARGPTEPPPTVQVEIDTDPAWSPDGQRIIYYRHYGTDDNADTHWLWGVFLHDVQAARDTLIWPEFRASDFDWSPDGSRIAWTINAQLFISDLDRETVLQIQSPERSHSPLWSPCGSKLIYFIRLGAIRGLYRYDSIGLSTGPLLQRADFGDWLNSCDSVVVIHYPHVDSSDLAIFSLTSKKYGSLPTISGYKRGIAASPDGKTILIAIDGYGALTNIWKLELGSSQFVQLTTEGGDYPAWSPGGEWIVFTRIQKNDGHLWLMRPDGSEKHQITF